MKSESVVLVCVVNLLSQIVSLWTKKSPGNLCHRSSEKEASFLLCDPNCESIYVTKLECEALM